MADAFFFGMLGALAMFLGWVLGHLVLGPMEDRRLAKKQAKKEK